MRAKQAPKSPGTHSGRLRFHWLAGVLGLLFALCPLISAQTVAAKPRITEFPAPSRDDIGQVEYITGGSDGALWFTADSNVIGRITTKGVVSTFTLSELQFNDQQITSGPDKALWFTLPDSVPGGLTAEIGRLTTQGTFTGFPIPFKSIPFGITSGPDGNLYFTDQLFSVIGHITPQGKVSRFSYKKEGGYAVGIISGPDGNLWFTHPEGGTIGEMTPAGQFTFFPVPGEQGNNGGILDAITAGPDGALWFTIDAFSGNRSVPKVGRITPGGTITLFDVPNPTGGVSMEGITSGPDGNLWFTYNNGQTSGVGRITPGGKFTLFPAPSQVVFPVGITTGSDGKLWFTEEDGLDNLIGRTTTH